MATLAAIDGEASGVLKLSSRKGVCGELVMALISTFGRTLGWWAMKDDLSQVRRKMV